MRILFVSASPIKMEISIGNTFLNLFDGVEDIELASICTRKGTPHHSITNCFCISEKMLVCNLLKQTPVGRVVSIRNIKEEPKQEKTDGLAIRIAKRTRWTLFFWMQDFVWKVGKWKSPQLKEFVEEYNPDIIFTVLSNAVFLNNLILHIHSLTKAKLVLYAWDNNYSLKQFMFSPLRWIKHFIDRASMRKLAAKADLFYVISVIQKKDYEKSFHKKCVVLTKGAEFSQPADVKAQYHNPLQLVFTGNIGLNRWKSLKIIADALGRINADGVKAQLRIYTATPLTKQMEKALNQGESSRIMGSVPASEVARIQKDADLLVHVEALDLKNRLTVRQSFSTKIVDYLKAARPILAVGPKDVASIDHLIRNDCAIVADNQEELEEKLHSVLEDTSALEHIVQKAYACGRKHHNKQEIQSMLLTDLKAVCDEQ